MKEKKMIASVILGVALVSLISALVAALAESLTLFIDVNNVQGASVNSDYANAVAGVTVGGVVLGIVFVAVFLANKNYRLAVNLSLSIAFVWYCVASMIVLRCIKPRMAAATYATFTSYVTTAITLMVSAALVLAAWLYLTLIKKKEEPAKPVQDSSETENQ